MPPDTSTTIAPTAKMPSTMPLRIRSVSVGIDRKFGSDAAASAQKPTMTPRTRTSFRAQIRFQFAARRGEFIAGLRR